VVLGDAFALRPVNLALRGVDRQSTWLRGTLLCSTEPA